MISKHGPRGERRVRRRADGRLHFAHVCPNRPHAVGTVLLDYFDDGAAHDDAVGNLRHPPRLLRRGDAETDGAGDVAFRLDQRDQLLKSVTISRRTPVTPRDDTTYIKPSASRAIMAIRAPVVGAIMEIRATPCFSQYGFSSPFSSKGRSGTMTASMPASRQFAINASGPKAKTGLT